MEELYDRVKSYVLQGVTLLLDTVDAATGWLHRIVSAAAEKVGDCAYAAEQKACFCSAQVRDCAVETGERVKAFYRAHKKAILITAAAVSAILAAAAILCCVKKCGKRTE